MSYSRFLVILVTLTLMGASCKRPTSLSPHVLGSSSAPTQSTAPTQGPSPTAQVQSVNSSASPQTPNAVMLQKYIVIAHSTYSAGHPHEVEFSLHTTDGTMVNTIHAPQDLLYGIADNAKVFGSRMYYLSGSRDLTSIGEIDPETGRATIFPFTQTTNTNKGNVIAGIVAWTVSADNTELAWLDASGRLMTANRTGEVRHYPTAVTRPHFAWLQFSRHTHEIYMFISGTSQEKLEALDLENGSQRTVSELSPQFTISPSETYLAYERGQTADLHIKNLRTEQEIVVPVKNYDFISGLAFSPDEQHLVFSPQAIGGGAQEVDVIDIDGHNKRILAQGTENGVDFVSNTAVLLQSSQVSSINIDGTHLQKWSDGSYRGILTLDHPLTPQ